MPFLAGESQLAYYTLPLGEAAAYDTLKEVLACWGLSPTSEFNSNHASKPWLADCALHTHS